MTKLLTPLTEPLGLFWVILLLLTGWRLFCREWRRAAGPGILALLIYLIGGTRIPAHLLAGLERQYARGGLTEVAPADAVVMLGGILTVSTNDPLGFDLSMAADRAVTAVELVRRGKARVLVLGGGIQGVKGREEPEGGLIKRWLTAWGLAKVPVIVLDKCANTRGEAERVQALASQYGWRRLLLVTSASHMKRAEGVFRKLGLDVTCVACDFQGMAVFEQPPKIPVAPGLGGFQQLAVYLHERVGWWLYKCRGWV